MPKAWAKGTGTLGCPGSTVPLSVALAGFKGKDGAIRLVPVSLKGAAGDRRSATETA